MIVIGFQSVDGIWFFYLHMIACGVCFCLLVYMQTNTEEFGFMLGERSLFVIIYLTLSFQKKKKDDELANVFVCEV